ncbi:MAG: hypothetical protein JWO60_1629 [Frankiales bacterium]|nr:hypothetical protein [Frankiales bacterium]
MRRVLAGAALAVLLTGCASSPQDTLVERVDAVTQRANAGDADGVRDEALALQDEVSAQRTAGELSPRKAERLLALAAQVQASAALADPQEQERREQAARDEAAATAAREAAAQKAAAEQAAAEQAAAEKAAAEQAAAEQAAREAAAAEAAARASEDGKGDDKDDDKGGDGKGKKD